MRLYSTKNTQKFVDFRHAVLKGLPEDNGLYMPEKIPLMPPEFLMNPGSMGLKEIALEVSSNMFMGAVPRDVLYGIVDKAFTFDIPLKRLDDDIFVLELLIHASY